MIKGTTYHSASFVPDGNPALPPHDGAEGGTRTPTGLPGFPHAVVVLGDSAVRPFVEEFGIGENDLDF